MVSVTIWPLYPLPPVRRKIADTHLMMVRAAPRDGLDALDKIKNGLPCPGSRTTNYQMSIPWPSYYTNWAILVSVPFSVAVKERDLAFSLESVTAQGARRSWHKCLQVVGFCVQGYGHELFPELESDCRCKTERLLHKQHYGADQHQ